METIMMIRIGKNFLCESSEEEWSLDLNRVLSTLPSLPMPSKSMLVPDRLAIYRSFYCMPLIPCSYRDRTQRNCLIYVPT